MRMEAKNKYFKDAAHRSNFKNVCLTIAKRHQRLLCSYLLSNHFFEREVECGPGVLKNMLRVYCQCKGTYLTTYHVAKEPKILQEMDPDIRDSLEQKHFDITICNSTPIIE